MFEDRDAKAEELETGEPQERLEDLEPDPNVVADIIGGLNPQPFPPEPS